ncbi:histidinol-phosphate transaminase [Tulasnella sp. 403]|nr:histidinol-phosphate transaminase [Tulasnella sp. 403]
MSSLKSNAQYPHHFSIETLIRPNILSLTPYRCARDDYQTGVLLDANENSLGPTTASAVFPSSENMHLNRYPDPSYRHLKERFATFRGLPSEDFVFFGVGSDEVIDLLIRVTCQPSRDKVLITPPTYGMYSVCAQVNDVAVVRVPLDVEEHRFQIRLDEIKRVLSEDPLIKLVFVCSPGNPTGTLIPIVAVRALLEFPDFKGIVVVDEAYIDFAGSGSSAAALVDQYANLCVLQTLSKSFGLAGIRYVSFVT